MGTTVEIVPHDGEEIGGLYRAAARDKASNVPQCGKAENRISYWHSAAYYYERAATWFERGAAASIGHNRTQRYREAARQCRLDAEKCREQIEREKAA